MSDQLRIAELERALKKVQAWSKTAYERGVTAGRLSCNNQVREALVAAEVATRAVSDENVRFTELLEASEAEVEKLRKAEDESKAALVQIAQIIGCPEHDWKSIILELNDLVNK